MWPSTSCSLSSLTLNIVLGRASMISPSISIFSSLPTGRREDLDGPHVHRLWPLVACLFLVLDLRVLREGLEAPAVDAGVVDEQVAVTLVGGDEPVPLLVVEPLNGPGRHIALPPCRLRRPGAPTSPPELRHGVASLTAAT